jgi:predicted transcriptional regulator
VNTEEVNPHLTVKIVGGYVRHHRLGPDQLSDLITAVHRAIGQLGQPDQRERFGLLLSRCDDPCIGTM